MLDRVHNVDEGGRSSTLWTDNPGGTEEEVRVNGPATSDQLAEWKPLAASLRDDPYTLYRMLRDEFPAYCDTSLGVPIWLLSRHDDVSEALADWQTYSSVQGTGAHANPFAARNREGGVQMIESDPPLHDRLRDTAKARFSPRGVRELEELIRATATDLLADARRSVTFDVARDFAWPLNLRVAGEVIGIPEDDRTSVLGWYQDVIYSGSHERGMRAAIAYGDYFSALATERESDPRDDLISDLMRIAGEGLMQRADAVLLSMDLFEGCVDVPANLTGNGVHALASHPEQRAVLTDPMLDSAARRIAIEELARFDTPIQYLPRVTTRDVDIHGTTIPAGSRVRLVLAAANRDERHHADPDRLDLRRPPVRSVAFGVGVHFCIGAPLARLGVGIALPMALQAFPDYTLPAVCERPQGADIMRAFLTLPISTGHPPPVDTAPPPALRVVVDAERCEGHGQCVLAAPTVFDLDDELNLTYEAQVPAELIADVRRAAQLCPMQAIRLIQDTSVL